MEEDRASMLKFVSVSRLMFLPRDSHGCLRKRTTRTESPALPGAIAQGIYLLGTENLSDESRVNRD